MSYNQRVANLQKNISTNKLKNGNFDFIEKFISEDNISKLNNNNIGSIYTPQKTLSMFVSQAINQDGSCQNVVDKLALNMEKDICISTSGYCKARARLSTVAIENITKEIAIVDENRADFKWKFKGRNVYLVDGTTITMADTKANQKAYPQANFQKEGLGFPICRLVGIISLSTGSIIDINVGTYGGKGTGERMLFLNMLHNFKKGDIILADALYSTYSFISFAIEKGIDIVFVQNGSRAKKADFTIGEILGKNDHIITLKRPKDKPEWMSEEEAENRPKELRIREIKTGDKILITTFLCKKTTSAKIIKKLYKERWHIEVDFRNIKITLGLTTFKCKSPKMVEKEMWIHFLAYNIIRSLILDSALYNKMLPRKISFKNSLQLYLHYLENSTQIDYVKLLRLIAKKEIGNREGRIEPRAIKKRHNAYPLLMKTRDIAKAEVLKNGHPKKK
jgi:hypothetical protein